MRKTQTTRQPGFTLIELMTVVGIIGILTALLLPALSEARRSAQRTQCASNLQQLVTALTNYSVEFKGNYPGNVGATNTYWYNREAVGRYIHSPYEMSNSEQCIGSVFVCPAALDNSVRCYSMNIFASSMVSPFVEVALQSATPAGKLWKSSVSNGSNMILLLETFTYEDWPAEDGAIPPGTGKTGQWSSPAVTGLSGTPGGRFINYGMNVAARFGTCASQLCYFRHRAPKQPGMLGDAIGRINIGFADGHVALHAVDELYDSSTGKSTYLAMWSPIDRDVEAQQSQ